MCLCQGNKENKDSGLAMQKLCDQLRFPVFHLKYAIK